MAMTLYLAGSPCADYHAVRKAVGASLCLCLCLCARARATADGWGCRRAVVTDMADVILRWGKARTGGYGARMGRKTDHWRSGRTANDMARGLITAKSRGREGRVSERAGNVDETGRAEEALQVCIPYSRNTSTSACKRRHTEAGGWPTASSSSSSGQASQAGAWIPSWPSPSLRSRQWSVVAQANPPGWLLRLAGRYAGQTWRRHGPCARAL